MILGQTVLEVEHVERTNEIADPFASGGNATQRFAQEASFLPLDEVIASRAIFVIASGSYGRTGGRKRLWNQLNK